MQAERLTDMVNQSMPRTVDVSMQIEVSLHFDSDDNVVYEEGNPMVMNQNVVAESLGTRMSAGDREMLREGAI